MDIIWIPAFVKMDPFVIITWCAGVALLWHPYPSSKPIKTTHNKISRIRRAIIRGRKLSHGHRAVWRIPEHGDSRQTRLCAVRRGGYGRMVGIHIRRP